MRCLLLVSEFASDADWHYQQLAPALAELSNPIVLHAVRGFSARRDRGGTHPSRLLNGAAVYVRLLWAMVRHRPDAMLCITTPPGIQWWCALLGWLTRTPTACWLMDYHPEIEARMLETHRALRPVATMLRALDRLVLQKFHIIIALDQAMARLCKQRAASTDIVVFPPWPDRILASINPVRAPTPDGTLRLLHVGSLGRAHDLDGLKLLIDALPERCSIQLLGADGRTRHAFETLARDCPVDLEVSGYLPGDAFTRAISTSEAHFGIVLLKERFAGLVSPSKFTAYIAAGIPLLSIGPAGTAAHHVCEGIGAGVHIPNDANSMQLSTKAAAIMDPALWATYHDRAKDAHEWLSSYTPGAFAAMLDSRLMNTTNDKTRD